MTGTDTYNVPEPYDREREDTCDYVPPSLSLSVSGNKIVAVIKKGSTNIASHTLYVNGAEQNGTTLGGDGTIYGYTLKGTETSVKLNITDAAGYTASSEIKLTPTKQETKPETKPEPIVDDRSGSNTNTSN